MEENPLSQSEVITPSNPRWLTIPVAILLGAAMISASILYAGGTFGTGAANALQAATASDAPIVVKDPSTLFGSKDPVLGNANAKVTIVEFSDFQCPYCRQFFLDAFPQIKSAYIDTGKVRLIYRNFPLPFHPAAQPAALAGLCANEQGKFWQFHNAAFAAQQKQEPNATTVTKTVTFGVAEIKTWAGQVGLNMTQFNQCLDSAKYAADIDASTKVGNDNGVTGTPSFFVNGELIVGAQPFSVFKDAIDRALAK